MKLGKELQQLKQLQAELNNGMDADILYNHALKIYNSIKSKSLSYKVGFVNDYDRQHFQTYKDKLKRYQYKVIAELQEVLKLLHARNIDASEINGILNKLIRKNMFQDNAKTLVTNWMKLGNKPAQDETITI